MVYEEKIKVNEGIDQKKKTVQFVWAIGVCVHSPSQFTSDIGKDIDDDGKKQENNGLQYAQSKHSNRVDSRFEQTHTTQTFERNFKDNNRMVAFSGQKRKKIFFFIC